MTQQRSAWRVLWPWLPTLAMYAVICWFSAQPGDISDAQSAMITNLINVQGEWMVILVRKFAHVSLYLGLGAAAAFAWLWHDPHGVRRFRGVVLRAAALCAALAALDEFHQLFVPGRSAQISDVLLDTASAALGALCVAMYAKIRRRRRQSFGSTGKNR